MDRRTFISHGGAMVASLALNQTAGEAASKKIKVGVLGVAHSHAPGKIKLLRSSPDFELIGICAENDTVGRAYRDQGIELLSERDMLQRAEAIIVESAVRDHARHTAAALKAGRHAQVEKPPAATLQEFVELLELATRGANIFQVGYMWRFNMGLELALEAARKGWLGEVFMVRGTMNTWVDSARRPEWAEFKGGAMFEQGCHLIDPLIRLLGKPLSVKATLRKHGSFSDTLADNCVAVFEFKKALGIITNSTLHPNAGPQRSFEIIGTNGSALVRPIEPPELRLELKEAAGSYKAGGQLITLPKFERYLDELANFAKTIRGEKHFEVSPETELQVQEAVLRASEMI